MSMSFGLVNKSCFFASVRSLTFNHIFFCLLSSQNLYDAVNDGGVADNMVFYGGGEEVAVEKNG